MEIVNTYRTVADLSEGEYREKGSKFIAYAVQCFTEQEAKVYLEQWRKQHHQSRHVCYAYRFGLEKNVFRANDDGEPNNSAGIPILGQIQSFDLTNVLIGVVRYFGGTKLGVGGLIHAYKTAAKEAIENTDIIEVEVFEWVELSFEYSIMPTIMSWVKQKAVEVTSQEFELSCKMGLKLPLQYKEQYKLELADFSTVTLTNKGIF